jgi:hypothetical protein
MTFPGRAKEGAAHLDLEEVLPRCLGHTEDGDDTRGLELDYILDVDALIEVRMAHVVSHTGGRREGGMVRAEKLLGVLMEAEQVG